LRFGGIAAAAAALAACAPAPTPQVIEKVVEKEVTKIVEGTPQIVKETVVTEKTVKETVVVQATAAALPDIEFRCAMYNYVPQNNWFDVISKTYTELHPNVKFKTEVAPWQEWNQKLYSQYAAGTAPDLADATYPDFILKNQTLELSEYFAKYPDFSWDNIWPALVDQVSYDIPTQRMGGPKKYCIPWDAIYWPWVGNLNLFEKAGVEAPKENWTWADLAEVARKLTFDNKGRVSGSDGFNKDNVVQWGMSELTAYKSLFPMLIAYGGDFVNLDKSPKCMINSPDGKLCYQYVYDMLFKDYSLPTPIIMEGLQGPFDAGQIAISTGGSWMFGTWAASTKIKAQLLSQPRTPDGKFVTRLACDTFSGYAKTKYPAELADVLKYMLDPVPQSLIAHVGEAIPALKSETPLIKTVFASLAGIETVEGILASKDYWTMYWGPKGNEIEAVYGQEIAPLWLGEISVEKALQNVEAAVNKVLAQA